MAMQFSISGYDSLEQIGVGGMAAVYRARKISIDKVVAIKVLFPYLACDESFIERFQREAKAAARIQHENIVNVIDFGESEGAYFIVMEYYDGHSLDDILKAQGVLPPDVAVQVLLEVCYGLESAHAKDIVHRDVKPANVIYTSQGGIKIADFGLAKKSDSATLITQHGKVIGTPAYMSPEQAAGKNVGPQSDIFSLGVVAYELLCHQKPFDGDSYSEVLEKIQTLKPIAVTNLNPLIQPDFETIITKMLEKDTADRYQSVTEVIADIEKAMEKHRMTRDRRRLSSYVKDPDEYRKIFNEKTIARCLSQGAFYMQKGRNHLDEAILEFKRILYLDPDNERAKKNLERANAERGKDQTQAFPSTPVPGRSDPRSETKTGGKPKQSKKHKSVTVVAASAPRRRRGGTRRLFVGATVAAAAVSAVFVGYKRGVIDLSFLQSKGNTPPALSAPKRLSVSGGDKIEFSLQAVDSDGDEVRFYGSEMPQGASLSAQGEFVWDVGYDQIGTHKLVFYADDGTSASLSETTVEVQKTSPTLGFDNVGALQVEAGQELKKKLNAFSSSGKKIAYTLVSGPEGLTLSGNTLAWKPGNDQAGAHQAVVKAGDGFTSKTQTVKIEVKKSEPAPAQQASTGRVEWILPEAADIYVDGTLLKKRSRNLSADLSDGDHVLRAELEDGVTALTEKITIKPGEALTLDAGEIKYGKLSVYFLGGVGELRIDGKRFRQQPPFTAVPLPAGKHTVSCRMSTDDGEKEFEINVKEGQETVIEYEVGSDPVVTLERP